MTRVQLLIGSTAFVVSTLMAVAAGPMLKHAMEAKSRFEQIEQRQAEQIDALLR